MIRISAHVSSCVKGLLDNLLWSITSQVRGGGGSLVSVYGWKGFSGNSIWRPLRFYYVCPGVDEVQISDR